LEALNIKYKEDDTEYWTDPGRDKEAVTDRSDSQVARALRMMARMGPSKKSWSLYQGKPSLQAHLTFQDAHVFQGDITLRWHLPSSNRILFYCACLSLIGSHPTESISLYQPAVTDHTITVPLGVESGFRHTRTRWHSAISSQRYGSSIRKNGKEGNLRHQRGHQGFQLVTQRQCWQKFNKLIVVDIDLPVWADAADDIPTQYDEHG
jgi:hypothetical protein